MISYNNKDPLKLNLNQKVNHSFVRLSLQSLLMNKIKNILILVTFLFNWFSWSNLIYLQAFFFFEINSKFIIYPLAYHSNEDWQTQFYLLPKGLIKLLNMNAILPSFKCLRNISFSQKVKWSTFVNFYWFFYYMQCIFIYKEKLPLVILFRFIFYHIR